MQRNHFFIGIYSTRYLPLAMWATIGNLLGELFRSKGHTYCIQDAGLIGETTVLYDTGDARGRRTNSFLARKSLLVGPQLPLPT